MCENTRGAYATPLAGVAILAGGDMFWLTSCPVFVIFNGCKPIYHLYVAELGIPDE